MLCVIKRNFKKYKFCGFGSGAAEDSVLLGQEAASLSKHITLFRDDVISLS
jgi:hypothetical protein